MIAFAFFGVSLVELIIVGVVVALLLGNRLADILNRSPREIDRRRYEEETAANRGRLVQFCGYAFAALIGALLALAVCSHIEL